VKPFVEDEIRYIQSFETASEWDPLESCGDMFGVKKQKSGQGEIRRKLQRLKETLNAFPERSKKVKHLVSYLFLKRGVWEGELTSFAPVAQAAKR
jgi:hypothetical protein